MTAAAVQIHGLAPASRFTRALALAATPDPLYSTAEWAEARRFVAEESGSSKAGKWSNATTPFGVEIMDCLDPEHPARTVTLKIAAQMIKSEIMVNWFGKSIDVDPAPMMLLLPSLDEVRTWNATKWQPTVDATPALRGKVFEVVEKSGKGSTTNFKRFRGGFLNIVSATASKGLQMRSAKRIACDEIEEFPEDTGGRGDPIDQAKARADAHADAKFLFASTPGELPNCRISKLYEQSDRREFYGDCVHCGAWQTFDFDRLVAAPELPGGAALPCAACGVLLTELDKAGMLARGVWIKRHPDETVGEIPPACFSAEDLARHRARSSAGRDPGFWLTQTCSPFKTWGRLLAEAREAAGKDAVAQKTFRQQKLALAWDPATDAPDHVKLFDAKGAHVRRGVVPAWACLVTGACDVQNDRLEWAAYAWGPDKSGARFDWGVIEGDTLTDAPWVELAQVIERRFPGEATIDLGFDAFGIDSGGGKGRTAKVYAFVKRSAGLKALKGASDPRALPLVEGGKTWARDARGKKVTAKVWLVGGHEIKTTVYGMLHRGLDGADENAERAPWGLYFTADSSEEHFRQLTAEVYRAPRSNRPGALGWWEKLPGRANEQLDLAVYAYALAWSKGLERMGASEWAQLLAARARPAADAPLLDLVQRDLESAATVSPPAAAPADSAEAVTAGSAPSAKLTPNPQARPRTALLERLARLNGAPGKVKPS